MLWDAIGIFFALMILREWIWTGSFLGTWDGKPVREPQTKPIPPVNRETCDCPVCVKRRAECDAKAKTAPAARNTDLSA